MRGAYRYATQHPMLWSLLLVLLFSLIQTPSIGAFYTDESETKTAATTDTVTDDNSVRQSSDSNNHDDFIEHFIGEPLLDANIDHSSNSGLKDGPVKFEIVGDTSHLFSDEDFEKKEVVLLRDADDTTATNSPFVDSELDPVAEQKQQQQHQTPIDDAANTNTNESISSSSSSRADTKRNNSPSPHPDCTGSNLTMHLRTEPRSVQLVNGSFLTKLLSQSASTDCFLVLFYVPWCPFCTKLAPIYNALPRAFDNLDIMAFDVSKSIGYNTKFGTSAVPMILLFQHKQMLAKFNYTNKTLPDYIEFVANNTGMPGNVSTSLNEFDLVGPVPTVPVVQRDYYLLICWIFLVCVSLDYVVRNNKVRRWLLGLLKQLATSVGLLQRRAIGAAPNSLLELTQPPQMQMLQHHSSHASAAGGNQHPHPHSD